MTVQVRDGGTDWSDNSGALGKQSDSGYSQKAEPTTSADELKVIWEGKRRSEESFEALNN